MVISVARTRSPNIARPYLRNPAAYNTQQLLTVPLRACMTYRTGEQRDLESFCTVANLHCHYIGD
jgi:hypothetical protein